MNGLGPAPERGSTALRLTGADVLGLLHRISTNSVADMQPGQARATLFCDPRGRLLHRAALAVTADRAVWLTRDDAPGASLASFLDRYVFRDDVRIEDLSARWMARVRELDPGLPPGALQERDGVPVALRIASAEALVLESAVEPPADEDEAAAERRRILAGRPGHGHEIRDAFTPFEVGLAHELHLDKGCFTGQEALQRLVTYRGVRRRLARLRGTGPPPPVPADLAAGGEPAGVLTSAIADAAGWIGLGVVLLGVVDAPRTLELVGGGPIGPPEPLPLTRPQGRG